MHKSEYFSALLTDLSKGFDYLSHDLLIARLDAYGFKNDALNLIFKFLNNRKRRIKRLQPATLLKLTLLHGCFSCFLNCTNATKSRNASHVIFFSQIFFFFVLLKLHMHDNTPYVTGDCLRKTLQKVEKSQTLCLNGSLIIIWSQM